MYRTSGHSEGFALASALLIVLVLAGFSIGMLYQVNLETHLVVPLNTAVLEFGHDRLVVTHDY